MKEDYNLAGWAAIASALFFLPIMGLTIYFDLQPDSAAKVGSLLVLVIFLDFISKIFMLYALLRFRDLLNQRYQFHAVDHLIVILWVVGVCIGTLSYLLRVIPDAKVPVLITGATLMVLYGVLGIVYATRLLRLPGNLNGLLKPLAYTTIATSVCFLLVIPAPFGLALAVATSVILGLVLLRQKDEELEELEIV
jgi:hypothetical protein